jgi:hypothetical protein
MKSNSELMAEFEGRMNRDLVAKAIRDPRDTADTVLAAWTAKVLALSGLWRSLRIGLLAFHDDQGWRAFRLSIAWTDKDASVLPAAPELLLANDVLACDVRLPTDAWNRLAGGILNGTLIAPDWFGTTEPILLRASDGSQVSVDGPVWTCQGPIGPEARPAQWELRFSGPSLYQFRANPRIEQLNIALARGQYGNLPGLARAIGVADNELVAGSRSEYRLAAPVPLVLEGIKVTKSEVRVTVAYGPTVRTAQALFRLLAKNGNRHWSLDDPDWTTTQSTPTRAKLSTNARALQPPIQVSLYYESDLVICDDMARSENAPVGHMVEVDEDDVAELVDQESGLEGRGFSRRGLSKRLKKLYSVEKERHLVVERIEEAFHLAGEEHTRPAVVMAGALVEELLTILVDHAGSKVPAAFALACPGEKRGPNGYSVRQLGRIAEHLKLLPKGILGYAGAVWNYRNYVHVRAELAGDPLHDEDREIAVATLSKLLKAVK